MTRKTWLTRRASGLFSAQVKSPTSRAESSEARRTSPTRCCSLPGTTRWCGGPCTPPCAGPCWWRPTFRTSWRRSWWTAWRQRTASMTSCLLAQVGASDPSARRSETWNMRLFGVAFFFTTHSSHLLDMGTVLKVIALHGGNSLETEEVTLEELQVFKVWRFLFSPVHISVLPLHRTSITIPTSTTPAVSSSCSRPPVSFPSLMLHFTVFKVPTPIASMDISVKRVSSNNRRHPFQTF